MPRRWPSTSWRSSTAAPSGWRGCWPASASTSRPPSCRVFTMVQLLVYAAMQIPVGALLDRFGPKRLLLCGVTLMTVAQLGFAFADVVRRRASWPGCSSGSATRWSSSRCCASWPCGSRRCGSRWSPSSPACSASWVRSPRPRRSSSRCTSGAGRRPTRARRCSASSWRPSSSSSCGTRPTPTTSSTRSRSGPSPASVRAAWRTPGTRLGLWSHFSAQFGATVFALLWGYPFLVAGQGLSPKAAGILLMLMTVTTVVTQPAHRRVRHEVPVLALDPHPRHRLRDHDGLGGRAAVAGPGAAAAAGGARRHHGGRRSGFAGGLRPGPDLQPADPARAAPPASSTSAASSPRCRP